MIVDREKSHINNLGQSIGIVNSPIQELWIIQTIVSMTNSSPERSLGNENPTNLQAMVEIILNKIT